MKEPEYYEIDLLQLGEAFLKKWWIILVSAFTAAAIGFISSAFFITPKYKAETLMYVNNSSVSIGSANFSISASDLTAAQDLVQTYIVILESRNTLNAVIRDAGLDYCYEDLKEMISAEPVNDTEIFAVSVTDTDPHEAERIANSIAKILPNKISDVVDGSSVKIVDYAVVPADRVSPKVENYTIIGLLIGIIISMAGITISLLTDTKIKDEEYLIQNFDVPVLAVIPDLDRKRGGYRTAATSDTTTEKTKARN